MSQFNNLKNNNKDSSSNTKQSNSTTGNESDKVAKKRPTANPRTLGYSPGEVDNTPSTPPPPTTFASVFGLIKGEG
jgi:hypothetical protein